MHRLRPADLLANFVTEHAQTLGLLWWLALGLLGLLDGFQHDGIAIAFLVLMAIFLLAWFYEGWKCYHWKFVASVAVITMCGALTGLVLAHSSV